MTRWAALAIVTVMTLGAGAPFTNWHNDAWEANDGKLTVTVVDSNGQPVSGCTVQYWLAYRRVADTALLSQGVTGGDGVCSFTGLSHGSYGIRATKGRLGCTKSIQLTPQTNPAQLKLTLGVYHSISGTVRGAQCAPLEGAAVLIDKIFLAATTDEAGRFRIPHVPADAYYDVSFVKEGYGSTGTYATPFDEPFIVTMHPGGSVQVRVLDEKGNPASGCTAGYSYTRDHFFSNAQADEKGQFTTLCLRYGANVSIRARMERHGVSLAGKANFAIIPDGPTDFTIRLQPVWNIVWSDSSDPEGNRFKTFYPVDGPPGVSVKGKVVRESDDRPVMATVVCRREKDLKVRTARDGTFLFKGIPEGPVAFSVIPDDPALYNPKSSHQVSLSSGKASAPVKFSLRQGGVIQGRVQAGEEPAPDWLRVMLHPRTRHLVEPIRVSPNGSFQFAHVPPSKKPYRVVAVREDTNEEIVSATAGTLAAGQTTDEILLELPRDPSHDPLGHLRGLVVDEQGAPVSEVTLELPEDFHFAPAVTDDEGQFMLPFRKTGPAVLKATRRTLVRIDDQHDLNKAVLDIIEGESVQLTSGPQVKGVTVIVRLPVANRNVLGGIITDGRGNTINPEAMMWYSGESMGTWGNTKGSFFKSDFPAEPVVIEACHPGYQAKVLVEGRDFKRGDVDINLVLKPGPFSERTSIFQAVTGFKPSERGQLPHAERLWKRLPEYRKLAGNTEFWVRVLDPAGKPIPRIQTLRWNQTVLGLPDVAMEKSLKCMSYEDAEGWYSLKIPSVYIWAEGRERIWFAPKDPIERADVIELTLRPESRVHLKVVDQDGRAIYPVSVTASRAPERNEWRGGRPFSLESHNPHRKDPSVDAAGSIIFEHLSPGTYSFCATDGKGGKSTLKVTVEPNEDVTHTIIIRRKNEEQGESGQ